MLKKSILALLMVLSLGACTKYTGIPKQYHQLLDEALVKAEQNAPEIKKALEAAPANQKEAVAFLIAYMPEHDLKVLSADFILENTDYAFIAREQFAWAQAIPDSVFFNDVLPYASLNERRDNWRKDFYERFSKYVKDCKDIRSAIDSVNKNIRDEVIVDYNTKREKPDQSPYESMKQNMASCSGLSILLTDAFRAVGIPSRIGGTPNWHDKRGNHNWNEVWIDGQWYFTEYYPSGLNKSWFLPDAGKSIPDNPEHAIYASSWKPTGIHFPLVWDFDIKYVPAVNVSERYIQLYEAEEAAKKIAETHVTVKVMMFKDDVCTFQGDDRMSVNVDVFCGADQVGGGRTAGPTQDMNDVLEFVLEKNKTYSFNYTGEAGQMKSIKLNISDEPQSLKLYYK
ncbi:transglutaminase domain-containing protein [Carboxylicivirga sediminis]|uniref:Transglutaminase domain-containing protein n=1 Tax=Carboxylicivirga sediminis TaxID=2006564 RepID=A0A941IYV1_9BACT|nr:transglutaminase-like domain-containing protein [Carboxylicivirga sediminis]MBR8538276.1 transglutaminase domain-containing protein [Carboxylicivirga sediminis]